MARVVLDARARADLEHHLDVEVRARLEPLRLEQLALRRAASRAAPPAPRGSARPRARGSGRDVTKCLAGIDRRALEVGDRLAGDASIFEMRSTSSPHISMRTPCSSYAGKISTVSPRTRNVPRSNATSLREYWMPTSARRMSSRPRTSPRVMLHHALAVLDRVAESVDRRDGGDDDDVVALHEARRRAQPQPVDVLVDRRVLLNVRVGGGHVRFRLVVVVVRDEVLDRVVREEALELPVELRGERLVVREDERRPAVRLDDVGHASSSCPSR